ncbi:MAG: MoaD/ThiS family protein [Chloroflexota bacterium]
MNVRVTLFSILREKVPPENRGKINLELPAGATIADILRMLDIEMHVVCAVNGQVEADHSRILQDGDEVRIFRPAGGGIRRGLAAFPGGEPQAQPDQEAAGIEQGREGLT